MRAERRRAGPEASSGLLEVVAHRVRRGLRREERLALALLRGHVADAAGQQREDAGRDAEERRVWFDCKTRIR